MVEALTTREVQEVLDNEGDHEIGPAGKDKNHATCVIVKDQWGLARYWSPIVLRTGTFVLHFGCKGEWNRGGGQATYLEIDHCYTCKEKMSNFIYTFKVMLEEGLKNSGENTND